MGDQVLQDQELLKKYVSVSDQAAFSELVRRHMSMVYATIWRLTGDEGISEEGTQNVFVILAKKAAQCCRVVNLGGWLHQCARNEARNMNRKRSLRKEKEVEAYAMMESEKEGVSVWKEILPVLDDVIGDLRAKDREIIVSRFLEERSFSQIGKLLGISEDGAQKRASRALERLSVKLKRRGVGASVVVLGAGLAAQTSKAAPPTLLPKLLTVTASTSATTVGTTAFVAHWLSLKSISLVVFAAGALTTTYLVLNSGDEPSSPPKKLAVLSPETEQASETKRKGRRLATEGFQMQEMKPLIEDEILLMEHLLKLLALLMDSIPMDDPDYDVWLEGSNTQLDKQQRQALEDLYQKQKVAYDKLMERFKNTPSLSKEEELDRLSEETKAVMAMWRPEDQILHVLRDDQKARFLSYVQQRRMAELESRSSETLAEIDRGIHLDRLQMQPVYDVIYGFGGKTPKVESLEKILTPEQLERYAQYIERN